METVTRIDASAPLLGFWYPALLSKAVPPGHMQAQTLLNVPLVICRDRQGRVAALRDLCPHRAMPLSFGHFDGTCVECPYHGWQFDLDGRCRRIPSLVEDATLAVEKIGVRTYPARDKDGYVWVYMPETHDVPETLPEVPKLPVLSERYQLLHIATTLTCTIDNGIVGLMDPAHGPFVHQSIWWRTRASMHEKAKVFEPLPSGFRMRPHRPSQNSAPYKLLGLSGTPVTTTIDFLLPNLRLELVEAGRWWFSSRATVTPITSETCRIDFCAAWNCFRWVPLFKPLVRSFARMFLKQDKRAMERQALGLRSTASMMLLGDADMPARWYLRLKAAYLATRQHGGPLEHPLQEPVTLRWRS
jgi:phenylpropionate dioxygenase-like ring-hydroxylating dioxygenase large terminal subunit